MARVIMLAILFGLGLLAPARAAVDGCKAMLDATGMPEYRGDAPAHLILCRKGYVLSYNVDRKVPDWVLEILTPGRLTGTADRGALGNPFKTDKDLKKLEAARNLLEQRQKTAAKLKDYRGSGCDRGHLAPAADMKWSDQAMIESFFLTNMAPQEGIAFNRGIWARLESQTRDWLDTRPKLVVISGPIYDDTARDATGDLAENKNCQKEEIGDGVVVPNKFYKIAYAPARRRAIAFILPNRRLKGRDIAEFRVPVLEVEELTGIDFFGKFSKRYQRIIERRKSPMWRH